MGVVPGRSEMKLSITKQSTQKVSLGSEVELFHLIPQFYSNCLCIVALVSPCYKIVVIRCYNIVVTRCYKIVVTRRYKICCYTLCAEKGERKLSEHLKGRKTHTPQTFTVCHQQKDRQRLGRDPLTQNIGPQMNGTAFLANIFGLFEHQA